MHSVYANRSSWGRPVPIDPVLLVAADDIYNKSAIFGDDEIETARTSEWEDRDYLSADWFVRNFTENNLSTKFDAPKGHYRLTRLWLFQMSMPTIGEIAFVTCRYPLALDIKNLPNWGDHTTTLIKGFHRARELFPEYEALGWALLHNKASDDKWDDTFESEGGFSIFHDKGIPFDTVARYVAHGVHRPKVIMDMAEHDVDPNYFGVNA